MQVISNPRYYHKTDIITILDFKHYIPYKVKVISTQKLQLDIKHFHPLDTITQETIPQLPKHLWYKNLNTQQKIDDTDLLLIETDGS